MAEGHCPPEEELIPLATGETAADSVQTHLRSCPACRQRVQQLQAEVSDLRKSLHVGPAATPSPDALVFLQQTVDAPPGTNETPLGSRGRESPEQPITGTTIGKYLLVDVLGRGGQGLVYLAVHPTLGKQVVLKLCRASRKEGDSAQRRLVEEGKLLVKMEHPNLARVYDLDVHEGQPFLVLEYVPGCSLEQQARQQRYTPRQAAVVVARVARALAVAHGLGILHLDVKPANIVLDDRGEPRLIDFGMALWRHAWAGPADPDDSIGGTPAYMAPEQARGELDGLGPRSDVFALGGVLYFLLVGHAPFTGKSVGEILGRAERCAFDPADLKTAGVPRALRLHLSAGPVGRPCGSTGPGRRPGPRTGALRPLARLAPAAGECDGRSAGPCSRDRLAAPAASFSCFRDCYPAGAAAGRLVCRCGQVPSSACRRRSPLHLRAAARLPCRRLLVGQRRQTHGAHLIRCGSFRSL